MNEHFPFKTHTHTHTHTHTKEEEEEEEEVEEEEEEEEEFWQSIGIMVFFVMLHECGSNSTSSFFS